MSNTTITPSIGAATLAGVAAALLTPVTIAPGAGLAAIAGNTATPTAANVQLPGLAGGQGQRISVRGLGAGAILPIPIPQGYRGQVKLWLSGRWTNGADVQLQAAIAGGSYVVLGSVNDQVAPGYAAGAGGSIYVPGNGLLVLSALDDGPRFQSLQIVIANGDGSTSINVDGFVNPYGAV